MYMHASLYKICFYVLFIVLQGSVCDVFVLHLFCTLIVDTFSSMFSLLGMQIMLKMTAEEIKVTGSVLLFIYQINAYSLNHANLVKMKDECINFVKNIPLQILCVLIV